MDLGRIERKYARITLTAKDDAGAVATVNNVDVALVPERSQPTQYTTWEPYSVTDGMVRLLLAGPEADDTNAVVVAESMDLWVRVTDNPEVDTALIETIDVI